MSKKKMIDFWLLPVGGTVVLLLLSLISPALSEGPKLEVFPKSVEYKPGVTVKIVGSGFKPKQEVGLVIMLDGMMSDISFMVKPRPVADDQGNFTSVWKPKREISRKLIKPEENLIEAVDENGKTLAKQVVLFEKK